MCPFSSHFQIYKHVIVHNSFKITFNPCEVSVILLFYSVIYFTYLRHFSFVVINLVCLILIRSQKQSLALLLVHILLLFFSSLICSQQVFF